MFTCRYNLQRPFLFYVFLFTPILIRVSVEKFTIADSLTAEGPIEVMLYYKSFDIHLLIHTLKKKEEFF